MIARRARATASGRTPRSSRDEGLVGRVTKVTRDQSRVTLLTDKESAVSAYDIRTEANGVIRHGAGSGDALILDRVPKEERVRGTTSSSPPAAASACCPRSIPATSRSASVTSVGQTDIDDHKQIQVEPFVDFSSLESVLVLVRKTPEPPAAVGHARRRLQGRGPALPRRCRPGDDHGLDLDPRRHARPRARPAARDRAAARLDLRRRSAASGPGSCSTPPTWAPSGSRRFCSRSPATGSAATARRPVATERTRPSCRSPS